MTEAQVNLLIISFFALDLLLFIIFAYIFKLNKKLKTIMATQKEIAAELVALKEQTEKIKAEVIAKLAALADAIANQGNASPEVEAALADLKTSVQGVDDLNEDAPVEPPVEG